MGSTRFPFSFALIVLASLVEAQLTVSTCGVSKGCWPSSPDTGSSQRIVTWKPDGDNVRIELSSPVSSSSGQYLALAFSENAGMPGSDFVVYCNQADQNLGAGKLSGYAPPTIINQAYTTNVETESSNGRLTCSFSIPSAIPDSYGISFNSLSRQLHFLVSTAGLSGTSLSKHANGAKEASTAAFDVTAPVGNTIPPPGDGSETTTSTTTTPPSPAASPDCGKTVGCWSNTLASVTWKPMEESVQMTMSARLGDREYIALGFSNDGKMGDDFVIWCSTETTNLGAGHNPGGYSGTTELDKSYVSGMETSYEDGSFSCNFSLPHIVGIGGSSVKTLKQELRLLQAKGSLNEDGGLEKHTDRKVSSESFDVTDKDNLESGSDKDSGLDPETRESLQRAHGALMSLAWLVFVSIAVLMPRFYRTYFTSKIGGKDSWFTIHQVLNGIGVLLTIVAFVMILIAAEGKWVGPRNGSDGLTTSEKHALFGLFSIILALLNPVGALLRPSPDSPKRPVFNWIHRIAGFGAWIFSIIAIITASQLWLFTLKHGDKGLYAIIEFLIIYLVIFLALNVHWFVCERNQGQPSFMFIRAICLGALVILSFSVWIDLVVFLADKPKV